MAPMPEPAIQKGTTQQAIIKIAIPNNMVFMDFMKILPDFYLLVGLLYHTVK